MIHVYVFFFNATRHEGRTWYTPHRGRLWIAATAKSIDAEEIAEYEEMFRLINGGMFVLNLTKTIFKDS